MSRSFPAARQRVREALRTYDSKRVGEDMETEKSFFNYPRAAIERRKLVRQLRRLQMQSNGGILPSVTGSYDVYKDFAALENELALCEGLRSQDLALGVYGAT